MFGIFTGTWLAFGLTALTSPPGQASPVRFVLAGLYELTSSVGVEHAAGIVGLVFVGVASYVGFAVLLEDNARRTILPIGRRGLARAAFTEGLTTQAMLHDLDAVV